MGRVQRLFLLEVIRKFFIFSSKAPQPRGHVQISSTVRGLPLSYTLNRRCETPTGIDPSPIQRKLTSRLGSMEQPFCLACDSL
ncbi:hypothetical protein PoB_003270400 [Plakobranchus ocellatus]|uniref:Secreted protein n=1 Tax=Plakobranchus ocellatus TaxID=259542 RepID=A0AAV4AEW8_9GAST|nr:hypothetical protein PoB_003270400 [Plakobranchus ocellatus]